MGRAPNKKTIADAVTLCAVMPYEAKQGFEKVCNDLGLRRFDTAARLADKACDAIYDELAIPFPDCWAEAGALIESGWRIGDPVERLESDTLPTETEEIATTPGAPWVSEDDVPKMAHDYRELMKRGPASPQDDAVDGGDFVQPVQTGTPGGASCNPPAPRFRPDTTATTDDPIDEQYAAAIVTDAVTGEVVKDRHGPLTDLERDAAATYNGDYGADS